MEEASGGRRSPQPLTGGTTERSEETTVKNLDDPLNGRLNGRSKEETPGGRLEGPSAGRTDKSPPPGRVDDPLTRRLAEDRPTGGSEQETPGGKLEHPLTGRTAEETRGASSDGPPGETAANPSGERMDEPPSGGELEDPPTGTPGNDTPAATPELQAVPGDPLDVPLSAWLAQLHLGAYAEALAANGCTRPGHLAGRGDAELARLGVALPGHRKRILSRLRRLEAGGGGETPSETPFETPAETPRGTPGVRTPESESPVSGRRLLGGVGDDAGGAGDGDDDAGRGDGGRRRSSGRGLAAWSVESPPLPPVPSRRSACQRASEGGADAASGAAPERRRRAPAMPASRMSAAALDGAGAHQLPISAHPFFLGAGAGARLSPRLVRSRTVGDDDNEGSSCLAPEQRLQQEHRRQEQRREEHPPKEREKRELWRRSSAPPAPVSAAPVSPAAATPQEAGSSPRSPPAQGSPRPLLKGYLYKTASSSKLIAEKRSRDEFSRRRCELWDGELRYFDGERSGTPNGRVACAQLCSLAMRGAANPTLHGFEHTFELCVCGEGERGERGEGERIYLFGTESEETCREWVTQLARRCAPPAPESLLAQPWERLGRLSFRDGYCSQRWRRGWFALVRCSLLFLDDEVPGDGEDPGDDPGDHHVPGCDATACAAARLHNGAAQPGDGEVDGATGADAEETEQQPARCHGAGDDLVAPAERGGAPEGMERGAGERLDSVSLNKLRELSVMTPSEDGDKREVLLLGERRRMLCVRAPGRLCAAGWLSALRKASEGRSEELSQVQLTDGDVPVIVSKCLAFVTQHGLAWEGVYRKTGVNSRIAALLGELRADARGVRLGDHTFHVDDVTTALRRFLREARPSLFTPDLRERWVEASREASEEAMLSAYRELVAALPPVNRATLTEIIAHLHCVQSYASLNHMTSHNLAIVFTPSLFHSDGKSHGEGVVLEHLIAHYPSLFHVSEEQLKARQQETDVIVQMTNSSFLTKERAGDMIIEVYLLHKNSDSCLSLQVSAAMTALELADEVLAMRPEVEEGARDPPPGAQRGGGGPPPWAVFEVIAAGELERALHYRERVLDTVLAWRRHADFHTHYLIVRQHPAATAMQHYLGRCAGVVRWEGAVRLREEATRFGELLPVSRFHEKFLVLSAGVATVYRDPRASRAEREWPVSTLSVYRGVRKKLRPPTEFGVTVFHGRQQWYLCFDNDEDIVQWYASILHTQHEGDVWGAPRAGGPAAPRGAAVRRVGKRSLVSLRGDQREIRKSLAALSAAAAAGNNAGAATDADTAGATIEETSGSSEA